LNSDSDSEFRILIHYAFPSFEFQNITGGSTRFGTPRPADAHGCAAVVRLVQANNQLDISSLEDRNKIFGHEDPAPISIDGMARGARKGEELVGYLDMSERGVLVWSMASLRFVKDWKQGRK
jgi:hypothetical protein